MPVNETEHPQSESFSQVAQLLEEYFQGLYYGDIERLAGVFHPLAHYTVIREGELVHYDMPTYFEIVRKRVSPHSQNELCSYEIVSVDFADANTALAKMKSTMLGYHFVDYLNLVKIAGQWSIIAKLFAARPRSV